MKPVENADFDDGSTGSGESKRSLVGRNGSEVIIMIMMIFFLLALLLFYNIFLGVVL